MVGIVAPLRYHCCHPCCPFCMKHSYKYLFLRPPLSHNSNNFLKNTSPILPTMKCLCIIIQKKEKHSQHLNQWDMQDIHTYAKKPCNCISVMHVLPCTSWCILLPLFFIKSNSKSPILRLTACRCTLAWRLFEAGSCVFSELSSTLVGAFRY